MTTCEALDALRKLRARIDADVTEILASWVHDYHEILDSTPEWAWFGLALRIPQSEIQPSRKEAPWPPNKRQDGLQKDRLHATPKRSNRISRLQWSKSTQASAFSPTAPSRQDQKCQQSWQVNDL